ncbi:retrotransposon protein [Cucumis melo var. makuwa]|uniref:Retrotransposon protein n=1 Tax=Cucumis melo var. makuwa TaxID=1194695 RepID=A0A5A7TCF2_CUCMM|nr:retrotransposon protein [Cucumis melo var. makuwa]TYK05629.1 retrotransposon protein [Cucumis melo var. makuwa]
MDHQTFLGVLTAFTMAQRQMLLTLEALVNDNKRFPQTPYDIKHRIRQLAYFRMIHESDLVCSESTRMDCLGALDGTYIKVNVPATDLQILWIPLLDKTDCKCQRDIIIYEMRVIQMLRDFLSHKEASATTCKSGVFIILSMTTSSRALKHVWTKEEEKGTLVECLRDLVSMEGGENQRMSHPAAKGLLNKPFSYYDELSYVFDRDRATGRFAEMFADVGSTSLSGGCTRITTFSCSEGRTGSSGSTRKRGSQREAELEVIHMALE